MSDIAVVILFVSLISAIIFSYTTRETREYICEPMNGDITYVQKGLEDNLYIVDTINGSVYFRTSCEEK